MGRGRKTRSAPHDSIHVPPFRLCSTEFQTWLWWKHGNNAIARWVCRMDLSDCVRAELEKDCMLGSISGAAWAREMIVPDGDSYIAEGWFCVNEDEYTDSPKNVWLNDFDYTVIEWLEEFERDRGDCEIEEYGRYRSVNTRFVRRVYIPPWPTDVSSKARFEILQRDRFRCQLCGASVQDGACLEVDHIVPRSRGGRAAPWNLWTLCRKCNSGKSNEPLVFS